MRLQDKIAINNMRLEGHSPSVIAAKLERFGPTFTATPTFPEPKPAKIAANR